MNSTIRAGSNGEDHGSMSLMGDEPIHSHPFCVLPPDYFERLLAKLEKDEDRSRTLLSIHTWDGREVLSVDARQ